MYKIRVWDTKPRQTHHKRSGKVITYNELNIQNDRITELSNVLAVLLKDRTLCDSETCRKLFYNYMELVNCHLQAIDTSFYPSLLNHNSKNANATAKNFMRGSMMIKQIMSSYVKKWCDKKNQALSIGRQYDAFLKETDEMFEMILNRIQDETENLYPMVRKISNG